MPDVSFRVEMAGDVPVVVTPSDIDITKRDRVAHLRDHRL